jgi:hypothetical protein
METPGTRKWTFFVFYPFRSHFASKFTKSVKMSFKKCHKFDMSITKSKTKKLLNSEASEFSLKMVICSKRSWHVPASCQHIVIWRSLCVFFVVGKFWNRNTLVPHSGKNSRANPVSQNIYFMSLYVLCDNLIFSVNYVYVKPCWKVLTVYVNKQVKKIFISKTIQTKNFCTQ